MFYDPNLAQNPFSCLTFSHKSVFAILGNTLLLFYSSFNVSRFTFSNRNKQSEESKVKRRELPKCNIWALIFLQIIQHIKNIFIYFQTEYCSDSFQVSGMCLVNIVRVRRGNILQTHEARNAWGLYKTKNYAFPFNSTTFSVNIF